MEAKTIRTRDGRLFYEPPGVNVRSLLEEEAELVTKLAKVREILGILAQAAAQSVHPSGTPGRPMSQRSNQIVQVLQEAGRPLSIAEIYARLRALDPSLHWTAPSVNIAQIAARYPSLIQRVGLGTYALVE